MRYRIFRKKTYIMQEQAPISAADSNALAARNCEGTEQLRMFKDYGIKISHVLTAVVVTWLIKDKYILFSYIKENFSQIINQGICRND